MQPHKLKIANTQQGVLMNTKDYLGYAFRIQAVYYSSSNPSSHIYLYDKDEDAITFPIPGQMEPKLVDVPNIGVKLPIKVLDETGDNSVVIYGEVYKPSLTG